MGSGKTLSIITVCMIRHYQKETRNWGARHRAAVFGSSRMSAAMPNLSLTVLQVQTFLKIQLKKSVALKKLWLGRNKQKHNCTGVQNARA